MMKLCNTGTGVHHAAEVAVRFESGGNVVWHNTKIKTKSNNKIKIKKENKQIQNKKSKTVQHKKEKRKTTGR